MDTVTIPKKEYARLKALEEQKDFEEHIERSLEDARAGRIIEY